MQAHGLAATAARLCKHCRAMGRCVVQRQVGCPTEPNPGESHVNCVPCASLNRERHLNFTIQSAICLARRFGRAQVTVCCGAPLIGHISMCGLLEQGSNCHHADTARSLARIPAPPDAQLLRWQCTGTPGPQSLGEPLQAPCTQINHALIVVLAAYLILPGLPDSKAVIRTRVHLQLNTRPELQVALAVFGAVPAVA